MANVLQLLCFFAVHLTRTSGQIQIDGSGTTNPSKFFWKVMETMQARTRTDIRLTYRAVGSSTGQAEFAGSSPGFTQVTKFGAGDIPMTASRYSDMAGASRTMYHLPFAVGAIAIFHSVPAAEVGNEGLKLSACNLGKIFSGTITTWDDPLIKADNPQLNVPAGTIIKVGYRGLGSSSTSGLQGWANAACSTEWTQGTSGTLTCKMNSNCNANWVEVTGSPGMTSHISGTSYALGYLDAGHGHQANLQEVMLQNAAGTWLTSTQSLASDDGNGNNGVSAAAATATNWPQSSGTTQQQAEADWSSFNLYNQGSGTNDWPIVLLSYIYVNKDLSVFASGDEAKLMLAFLDVVFGTEGQNMLAEFSFNKIPSARNLWIEGGDAQIGGTAGTIQSAMMNMPAGGTTWTGEDSVTAVTGQGAYVLSPQRNTYTMWQVGELVKSVTAMETRVNSLEQNDNEFGVVPLHGSGTTNPKNWFAQVMKLMEQRSRQSLFLTYRAVGSGTGMREFVGNENNSYASYNHFGCGDIPVSASLFNMLPAGQEMMHIPFAHSAIGIFHSVPGVTSIRLTPCVLAKIFDGAITKWNHADITNLNSGETFPDATIIVGHRALGSSSTGGITGYLADKCSGSWSRGSGSTITWPTSSGFREVQGSPGMQSLIQGTPNAIGYLDAGHGHDLNLAEISIQNAAGNYLTSKESMNQNGVAEAGTQGLSRFPAVNQFNTDFSAINLYGMAGANTWPIVLTSYFYVKLDQTQTPKKTAALLKAFVTFILENKDSLAASFGFTPLGDTLKQRAMDAFESLMVFPAGMQEFTFEESTDPYNGMGTQVISSKRIAYDDYARTLIDDKISRLETQVADLSGSAVIPLHGSGTTNPKSLFAKVMKMMEDQAKQPLFLTYRAVGSSTGQKEFVGQSPAYRSLNHFAAGDIPMDSVRFADLDAQNIKMVHVPFALGAIGIFHSVPGGQTVNMDACLLAKVFLGTVTRWDHEDIMAQNPNLQVPAQTTIRVGHRTEGSSSTSGLTGYLNKKCGNTWTEAGGSSRTWATSAGFTAVQGSPGMEEHIRVTEYAIGYLDAGHGISRGFSEIKLMNAAGQSRTAQESIRLGGVAEAGTQAVTASPPVIPTSATVDWSAVNLYDMPGTNTWPIVLVSYFYIRKDQTQTNVRTAAALKAFVEMVLSNPGNVLGEFGFTPPSDVLKNTATAGLNAVDWPSNMVAYTWENSTAAYTGMGDTVISLKRFAYDDLERELLESSITTLRESVNALQARLDSHSHSSSGTGEHEHDDGPDGLAVASLTVACVSICISAVATALALRS